VPDKKPKPVITDKTPLKDSKLRGCAMLHNWIDGVCSRCGAFEPKKITRHGYTDLRATWPSFIYFLVEAQLDAKTRPPGQTMLNFRLFLH
jgi:hypothetical protein